jgi:hypothetical protein
MSMAKQIRDPVSRVRQSFEIQGESLVVDNWIEPGGALPAHYPQQEERWSVLEGQVRFRHRDDERASSPTHGSRSPQRPSPGRAADAYGWTCRRAGNEEPS